MLVALLSSTSVLMSGGSGPTAAVSGMGMVMTIASLPLLLSNLSPNKISPLRWFEGHSTTIEVVILSYPTVLLSLNALGAIDIGWSRWLVISSQTILLPSSSSTGSSTSCTTG